MKKIIIIFISILLLFSCSKKENKTTTVTKSNIEQFINTSEPSNPDFSVKFEKDLEIMCIPPDSLVEDSTRFIQNPAGVVMDDDGNIYILDEKTSSIKKFSKDGNYIKSFGRKGSGPGEFTKAISMVLQNDTLYVGAAEDYKVVKFSKDGEFYENKKFSVEAPAFLEKVGDDKFIGLRYAPEVSDKGVNVISKVILFDYKFDEIKSLEKSEVALDLQNPKLNPQDIVINFKVGEDKIYIPKISEDVYSISVFDFDGNLKQTITKSYRKIEMTQEEALELQKKVSTNVNGSNVENSLTKTYHKAIYNCWVDKNNRLWVLPTVDKNLRKNGELNMDVFIDGVFIKNMVFPVYKTDDMFSIIKGIQFIKDKVIVIDESSDNPTIKIYSY